MITPSSSSSKVPSSCARLRLAAASEPSCRSHNGGGSSQTFKPRREEQPAPKDRRPRHRPPQRRLRPRRSSPTTQPRRLAHVLGIIQQVGALVAGKAVLDGVHHLSHVASILLLQPALQRAGSSQAPVRRSEGAAAQVCGLCGRASSSRSRKHASMDVGRRGGCSCASPAHAPHLMQAVARGFVPVSLLDAADQVHLREQRREAACQAPGAGACVTRRHERQRRHR